MREPVWSMAPDIAFVDDGDRVVAVSLAHGTCRPCVLEDTAASIWRALEAGHEPAITQAVAREYGVDDADVAEDVRSFLHQLQAQGLATGSV